MIKYQRLLILLSIVFALLAVLIGHQLIVSGSKSQVKMLQIPVAKHHIAAMSVIGQQDIDHVQMPEDAVKNLAIIQNDADVIGRTNFEPIEPNSPFVTSNLLSDKSEAPFSLPKGYRAVTIENSALIGVAGFAKPGTYVDVLWNFKWVDPKDKQKVNRTLVAFQNVRVLAIDTKGEEGNGSDGTTALQTVTLMMTLPDAQSITTMTSAGKMKLALRPSENEEVIPKEQLPPSDVLITE